MTQVDDNEVPLLRRLVGQALRRRRLAQGRTLRDVAQTARVSMPYLSEVERGLKEASSEVLAAICRALRVRLSDLLDEVRIELARVEPEVTSLAPSVPMPTVGAGVTPPATAMTVPAGDLRAMNVLLGGAPASPLGVVGTAGVEGTVNAGATISTTSISSTTSTTSTGATVSISDIASTGATLGIGEIAGVGGTVGGIGIVGLGGVVRLGGVARIGDPPDDSAPAGGQALVARHPIGFARLVVAASGGGRTRRPTRRSRSRAAGALPGGGAGDGTTIIGLPRAGARPAGGRPTGTRSMATRSTGTRTYSRRTCGSRTCGTRASGVRASARRPGRITIRPDLGRSQAGAACA